jgi:uncharacterized membrane protein
VEIVLLLVGAMAVLVNLLLAGLYWNVLPELIPIHFNFAGVPDGWGAKLWLVATPLVSVVMWASIALLSRIPHQFNYLWPITAENALRQYRLARTMMVALSAGVAVMFALLTYEQCRAAMGEPPFLGMLWSVLMGVFVIGLIGWYGVSAYRAR